jgi:hypothetical protein
MDCAREVIKGFPPPPTHTRLINDANNMKHREGIDTSQFGARDIGKHSTCPISHYVPFRTRIVYKTTVTTPPAIWPSHLADYEYN